MLAATLLVVAVALRWRPANGSQVGSTATIAEFACSADTRRFDVKVGYRTWRSVSVQVANSSFSGQCTVNVTWATSSERRQPELSKLLLLVKVERLRLNSAEDSFYVSMSNPFRRTINYCEGAHCDPTYLWVSQSVELYLYVTNSLKVLASYDAAFIVTEATNVCALANRSGELLVQSSGSSEYAFASDSRNTNLPPNNVACALDLNHTLTIRSSVLSASLNVIVLACPPDDSCVTLLLNGRSCSNSAMVASAPSGSPVTLHYVLRRCYNNLKFAGFVVRAEVYPTEPERPDANEFDVTVVAAPVAATTVIALAIGVAVALICRRRRLRSLGQKAPARALPHVRSAASACGEEIAMLDNDLYGVALASTTTAHQ